MIVALLQQREQLSTEAVRAKIDDVLARPEFRPDEHVLARAVAKFLERIVRALADLLGVKSETAGTILAWTVYTLLALALALIVTAILRRVLQRRGSNLPEPTPEDVRARRAAELMRRARDAQSRGDLVLALRLFFTALVVGLGQKGELEYRDAWTNRELLERGAPHPEVERLLRPLVPALDRKSFGGEPALPDDVNRLARLCDELLGNDADAARASRA